MKILNLTKAEVIKQTKKLSFKICLIILLVLAIGIPILFKVFNQEEQSTIYTKEDLKAYQDNLIEKPSKEEDKLTNDLNKVMIDIINKYLNQDIKQKPTEFRTNLYDDYSREKMNLVLISYMLNSKIQKYDAVEEEYNLDILDKNNLREEDLLELQKEKQKIIKNLENQIKENDYTKSLKQEIEVLKQDKTNKNNNYIIKVYQKLINLNIKDENDFRIEEAKKIVNYYNQKETPMSKVEYSKQTSKIKYEKYIKITKDKNNELDKQIKKSWYAINHNINYNKQGARTSLNEIVSNNVAFLSLIVVIISGSIVASEFQKGTIRLLVIRPNKRWKILLSKFLTIVLLTIGLSLITYLASFITNGILYNFKDYFIKDLIINKNIVKETSYIFLSIGKMFMLLIPVIFSGVIAFFLSTITRNTALSVGLSIFLQLGYGIVTMILVLISFPYLNLTFLPYLDYSQFINPLTLTDNYYLYESYYTLKTANIVLLIWGAILYGISNIVFTKKDIKN